MRDIKEQIKYLEKRIIELHNLCNDEIDKFDVSSDVRNITQDLFTRGIRLLDNITFYLFEKTVFPSLQDEERKKIERNIYFPVKDTKEDLKKFFSDLGLKDLEKLNSEIFSIFENMQPYKSGQGWIKNLKSLSNLGHRKLIAQRKKKDISLTLSECVKIGNSGSVTFSNCKIGGIPVPFLKVKEGEIVSGKIDPRLNPKTETRISYVEENSGINVLWLSKRSLEGIKKLVASLELFLK